MSVPIPPSPDEPQRKSTANRNTWIVIGGIILIVGIIAAVTSNSHPSPSNGNDLDQRTCEIARDIAASFNVTDTLEESRSRVVDLYTGYGEAASPAIAAGIRQWSAGLTTGNLHEAAQGVSQVDTACSSEGF
jgi:hypothetical protein